MREDARSRKDAPGPLSDERTPTRLGAWPSAPDEARTLFSLSRRHELPFSVVVVHPIEPAGALGVPQDAAARLREVVLSGIRGTDLASAWDGTGGWVVFCPATPEEGALTLVRRVCTEAGDLDIGIGTASFREDGFTLEDLVDRAAERQRASRPPGSDGPVPLPPLRPAARTVRSPARRRVERTLKRLFDLAVVIGTAPLWIPVAMAVGLAVKLSDPRAPMLFVQHRTGYGGRRFAFYKFRTMVRDAEKRKAELQHRNERAWPDFKIDDDPRITRIGRVLRATSLDELPQLWNVLRGDMSLVGPRPTSFPADTYQAWQTARLEVVPGLTGLWQVEARNETDFSERIRLDLQYVERQSFLLDLKILLRTVPAVLWNREGR